jgi:hypothetical protein
MGGFSSNYGSGRDYNFRSAPSVVKKTARDYAKDDKFLKRRGFLGGSLP